MDFTYIDKFVEIFLKILMKTVQFHLIIWTTLDHDVNNNHFQDTQTCHFPVANCQLSVASCQLIFVSCQLRVVS